MDRKKFLTGVVAFALMVGSVAVWYWWKSERDLEQVRQLQAAIFSKETRSLPEDERRAKFSAYREQYEKLSDNQKQELRQQMHSGMQRRMTERIDEFFALPNTKRVAFLDKQINEMEQRRKQFTSRQSQRGDGGRPDFGRGRGGGERGGSKSPAEREERRDRWRRERLDHSTPEQRAKFAEYMEALRKRREQRGFKGGGRGPRRITSIT